MFGACIFLFSYFLRVATLYNKSNITWRWAAKNIKIFFPKFRKGIDEKTLLNFLYRKMEFVECDVVGLKFVCKLSSKWTNKSHDLISYE